MIYKISEPLLFTHRTHNPVIPVNPAYNKSSIVSLKFYRKIMVNPG